MDWEHSEEPDARHRADSTAAPVSGANLRTSSVAEQRHGGQGDHGAPHAEREVHVDRGVVQGDVEREQLFQGQEMQAEIEMALGYLG